MTGKQKGLRFGPLGQRAVHLCVDMQRMFDSGSPWQTGWLRKVLPQAVRLCEVRPERTIFSKFVPARAVMRLRGRGGGISEYGKR